MCSRAQERCSDDKRSATVKEVGEIILAQGGNQQRRTFVFLQTQRGAQIRIGILTGIMPLCHRDHTQLPAGRAEHVHMALRR